MQTLKQALDLGLITKVTMSTKGLIIYSNKKPHGSMYRWDYYVEHIEPKLASKCKQQADTPEPQA